MNLKGLMNVFEKSGVNCWVVGGYVRDFILEVDFSGIDVVVDCSIEFVKKKLEGCEGEDIIKFENFDIVSLVDNGYDIIEEYLYDRDFTMNAMAMDNRFELIDPFGGLKDLDRGIIRRVRDIDKNRILRAIRFKFQFDMELNPCLKTEISRLGKTAAPSNSWQEFIKMAGFKNFWGALLYIKDNKISFLLPSLAGALIYKNIPQNDRTHPEGNLFEHIVECLKVVRHKKDRTLNLCTFFHDVGKLRDMKNHTLNGLKMVKNLPIKHDRLSAIKFCILNHMKGHDIIEMNDYSIMKLIRDENWQYLYRVMRADRLSRGTEKDLKRWQRIDKKIKLVEEKMKDLDNYDEIRSKINGLFVMDLLGIKEGQRVGKMIDLGIKYVIDKNLDVTNSKDMDKIKRYLWNKNSEED